MSRVASKPVEIPAGIEVNINGCAISVKGPKGKLEMNSHALVSAIVEDKSIKVSVKDSSSFSNALAGTTRALINNMVAGVSKGFEKKLQLVGVGFRAQAQPGKLNLTLGFSHPIEFKVPEGITVETPSQTEILIKGVDRQKVGQVAANIRACRPPEPYKGKGVRYVNEQVILKEAKKK